MGSYKKGSIVIVSALIAVLFFISGNNYSIETISNNYLKEVKASHQEILIHNTFENYYLPQSSSETLPLPEFIKIIHKALDNSFSISTSEHYFFYKKIIFHRLNSSEIVFPTHFFW